MGISEINKPARDRKLINEADSADAGFTLVELLIVVAIIGIITAIAIPGLIGAINQTRQKKSMAEMKTLATAVEAYNVDHNRYPIVIDGVSADLSPYLTPHILKVVPRKDGWGQEFRYSSDTGETYSMLSFGINGVPDLPYIVGPTRRYIDDILHSGGVFIQWPEGQQN